MRGLPVLPTHVGVSLSDLVREVDIEGPPHARGGEPRSVSQRRESPSSSPRTWG